MFGNTENSPAESPAAKLGGRLGRVTLGAELPKLHRLTARVCGETGGRGICPAPVGSDLLLPGGFVNEKRKRALTHSPGASAS